jgi:hypothetical protein
MTARVATPKRPRCRVLWLLVGCPPLFPPAVEAQTVPPDTPRLEVGSLEVDGRVFPVHRARNRVYVGELWNVLRGDMSLVGPRPPIPQEVERYDAYAWRRMDIDPGLTCTWQVSGRSRIPFREQCHLDIAYIQNRSLLMDCKLLLRTIPAVLSGKGAF